MRPYFLCRVYLMLILLSASVSAVAGLLGPSNLQECLLDELPSASNDTVTSEIIGKCSRKFGVSGKIEKKVGLFAAFHSGNECTIAKAKSTQSLYAARVIQANCYALYEPAPEIDQDTVIPDNPTK